MLVSKIASRDFLRDARRLELSVGYHTPVRNFRTLPSHFRTITITGTLLTQRSLLSS